MFRRFLFVAAVLLSSLLVAWAQAQTCTPPLYQGNINSTGNCGALTVRWLNRNPVAQIDHFTVKWLTDGVTQTLPGSALTASRHDLSCQWSSHVTITQFMTNGASCATTSTGPAPHTPACDLCSAGGASAGCSVVSSANFRGAVSRGSLVSLFPDPGTTFTDRPESAVSLAIGLPRSLGGLSVDVSGASCELLAVAPGQINLLLPGDLAEGPAELSLIVNATRGTTPRFAGRPQVNPSAPGIFTASANGEGLAAAVWLVARIDGSQSYYRMGALPPLASTDVLVWVGYATGINHQNCTLYLSTGKNYEAAYCGPSTFAGVQQVNVRIPVADVSAWPGTVGGFVRAWRSSDRSQGGWDSQGFDLRR